MKVYVLTYWHDRGDDILGVYANLEDAVDATPKNKHSKWLLQRGVEWDGESDVQTMSYEGESSWWGYAIERHEVVGA